MNSSFLYLLGDCINTIACVRNTKAIQSSYISKVTSSEILSQVRLKNGFRTRDFISLPIGGKKVILRMKVAATSVSVRIVIMIVRNGYPLPRAVTVTLVY